MISKVVLRNWKTHSNSEFSFGKGTNVLIGPMGSGKSLPYNELVLVKEGDNWKKESIGDVVERSLSAASKIERVGNGSIFTKENPFGIRVQTVNPITLKTEERRISQFIKHESPAELVKITTRQGKEITVTADHSMLVFEDGGLKPVKGSDIKKGDFIPCPKKMRLKCSPGYLDVSAELPEFRGTNSILDGLELMKKGLSAPMAARAVSVSKFTLANWRDRQKSHSRDLIIAKHLSHAVPTRIKLSNEFARICGAFVSEGSNDYSQKKGRYRLAVTNNDERFLETFESDWRSVFPKIPIKRIKNNSQVNSRVASALFLRLFGYKAGGKRLPPFILWLNDEQLSNFLGAYFEGDGCISAKRAELGCSSKSIELLDAIQTLLCRWGIISRLRKVKRKQGQYYELQILPKHIPLFAKHVSFLSEKKQGTMLKWVEMLDKRKRWDGVDIMPNIAGLLKELTRGYSLGKRGNKKMRGIARQLWTYGTKENLGREKLTRALEQIFENYRFKTPAFEKLEKIADSDIFFDKVSRAEKIPAPSKQVYDFAVDGTENFVAGRGNIITHNTSVMDAICFALFGTFPGLQARKISMDEIIRNKPNEADSAAVQLYFDYAGGQYFIERTIKRKGTNEAKVFKGGKIIAGPKPTDATKAVENAIEINYNLFSRAVYSEQNEIDYFLRLSPNERKQRFDELLDLKKYETVRGNAVTAANQLKARARDARAILSEQAALLSRDGEETLRKKIDENKKENAALWKKGIELEKLAAELKAEVAELEKKERQFNSLREQHSRKKGKAEELLRTVRQTKKEAGGRSAQELREEKKKLLGDEAKKEEEILQLEKEKAENQKALGDAEKKIAVNERRLGELGEHLLQLQGLKAACPVCKRKLEGSAKELLIEENGSEQKKLSEENKAGEKHAEASEKKARQIEESLRGLRREKEAAACKAVELRHLEERLAALEEKEKEFKLVEGEIAKLEKEIAASGFDERLLLEKRRKQLEAKNGAENSANEIRKNNEMVGELEARVSEIGKRREQLKATEEKIQRTETAAEKMNFFTNSLQAAQGELRLTLVESINQMMQNIWPLLYPYRDFVDARMHIEEGDYELKVKTRSGNWVRVEGILSGGERSAAAICIRIAFSLILTPNLSWLILDEPTHNLDTNAVAALDLMMQNSLPKMVEQVFVITHDNEMKKAASASLYMLERDKNSDGPTRPVLSQLEG